MVQDQATVNKNNIQRDGSQDKIQEETTCRMLFQDKKSQIQYFTK